MTEKDLDSMATVQIKQEYAPSEVYSTASEPPPAYKGRSNSVQIAKICAFTVIASSLIIGSFIVASAYLHAKASCDQMQTLDSVLEKELMLETMQQELPRAEALLGKGNDASDFQNLDKDDAVNKEPKEETVLPNTDSESDSTFSESNESDDLQKDHYKVPLELNLSDLAAALLENNKKPRMNCVIERKHALELVDSPARSMQLPFGVNLTTDPKKQRITGERISISCDSSLDDNNRDETENIRPIFVPLQRMPFGPQPRQIPLTHMSQHIFPEQLAHQMPPPFQRLPLLRPQAPLPFMQAPNPEPQVRIHLQRIPIREIPVPQEIQEEILDGNKDAEPGQSYYQPPQIQVQRVPLDLALQRAGITADDLKNIQRMAEERITDELRNLALDGNSSDSENSDSSEEEEGSNEQPASTQQPQDSQPSAHQSMEGLQILPMGRTSYGRSLPYPVGIPVPMMQTVPQNAEHIDSEATRPHYVQPRSVRSVDNVFRHREKRVKRCACDCNC